MLDKRSHVTPTSPNGSSKDLPRCHLPDSPLAQKPAKNCATNQEVKKPKTGNFRLGGKCSLVWEAVNAVTWRLIDPDSDQILILRSHGQWPAFKTPKALAWVFDVGVDKCDWRIRVRVRGGWQAFGCIGDLDTAKRIALREASR
jgi:hypothetical protein